MQLLTYRSYKMFVICFLSGAGTPFKKYLPKDTASRFLMTELSFNLTNSYPLLIITKCVHEYLKLRCYKDAECFAKNYSQI